MAPFYPSNLGVIILQENLWEEDYTGKNSITLEKENQSILRE